jgi:hypothetical protein
MKRIFIFCICIVFLACSNNENSTTALANSDSLSGETVHSNAKDTIITKAKPMILAGCYEMIFKRDTAQLNLDVKDTVITGTLNYHLYEKDKNTGTIKGVLRDNMIYADYTFQSEGTTSLREVIFKINDNTLVSAFGDLTEKQGKFIFRDKDHLQFQTANPFIKVACPK